MKWKNKEPKQSISSVTSMSFLSDENLTFHRFSDGTISFTSERKKSMQNVLDGGGGGAPMKTLASGGPNTKQPCPPSTAIGTMDGGGQNHTIERTRKHSYTQATTGSSPIWTTNASFNNYTTNTITNSNRRHAGRPRSIAPVGDVTDGEGGGSTTTAGIPTLSDLRYLSSPSTNPNNSSMIQNGSTVKLISTKVSTNTVAPSDDQSNKQSRSSIFRGVILCLCLNLTFANVVRFPRELQLHGSAFLVPYVILLLLVGLPVVLLEISLGQFLGQGSAHMWRAAPFLKGASLVGRIASWLAAIWTSMQSVIALLYIGMLAFKSVPLRECSKSVTINPQAIYNGYDVQQSSGQECLKLTFLRPVWRSSLYFGLLALSLILLWVISMVCTHSGKINRRSIYLFGFVALVLLIFETGWEVTKSINEQYFPDLWPFHPESFADSTVWFNALVQVIYSLNIGFGAVPVLTGKFLYKGDAIKTSFVYIFFNILITAIAVVFYVFQYNNSFTEAHPFYPELSALTVIYDRAISVQESDPTLQRLIPALSYTVIFISSLVSIVIYIYTSTRIIRKHPNYTVCLAGLVVAIAGLLCPNYIFPRILDTRIVGALAVCAMIFEIILIIWVYGSKNLYTDLEFSLGRPVLKAWLFIWGFIPVLLMALLCWWSITYYDNDLLIDYFPKWLPVVFSLSVIVLLACVEISKQVDYNIFSMIHGATKPSKDWGPADPLVRHAWKQWKSVCEDTGERDFTLRRRGTKDYTNSIKKGQYTHSHKYGASSNRNLSTTGSNSPNYSGSVFGDSAIEEDMSVEKYPHYNKHSSTQQQQQQHHTTTLGGHGGYGLDTPPPLPPLPLTETTDDSSPRISASSRKSSRATDHTKRTPSERSGADLLPNSRKTSDNSFSSRIDIMPRDEEATGFARSTAIVRNPLAKGNQSHQQVHGRHYHPHGGMVPVHGAKQNAVSYHQDGPRTAVGGPANDGDRLQGGYNRDIFISNGHAPTSGGAAGGDHICWRKFSINSEEYSTEL
ncbi:sodium-dependent nutrient amino acid transporter 1 isoform X1 [Anopheles merus]|uniref:sodium-dependent nutrient amino acid transporter 1 isoform X1 n=1 Tax=Anopheles merus TaxID=30066 RepID=UPI001BE3D622|nr:sodium-dependent nutrient amino acid transporter 1 isoform X1 [Anopheles merus]XP_041774479.1 sodium-dependent nutrient amino acid transporter 1 isoform X1 [Anopheles merus]XP_041774480.1 sodium-dependent nutrient amino acid transporter 1 isoform X1 [Anopheles merus]XP_041774481.1 sodium-dependent nutrient amino acid transporter 1 isoform X1 [Anopheles merus]XP_041774482.1 sodium-dependent nutrient amino acid transporter 1 isoform X1 [Anopheles merus]XP_041774483.1 sodium-dependent nutrient